MVSKHRPTDRTNSNPRDAHFWTRNVALVLCHACWALVYTFCCCLCETLCKSMTVKQRTNCSIKTNKNNNNNISYYPCPICLLFEGRIHFYTQHNNKSPFYLRQTLTQSRLPRRLLWERRPTTSRPKIYPCIAASCSQISILSFRLCFLCAISRKYQFICICVCLYVCACLPVMPKQIKRLLRQREFRLRLTTPKHRSMLSSTVFFAPSH